MKANYDKTQILGAARKVLRDIGNWTNLVFDPDAMQRLLGQQVINDSNRAMDWSVPGSVGPMIENSTVLVQLGRVTDYLNTGIWHGDPSDLRHTTHSLAPLQAVVAFPEAFWDEMKEFAVDDVAAEVIKTVLDEFEAREWLDQDMPLEVWQLALISGFAEKTIRMAAVGRNRDPDLMTYKEGQRTLIAPGEAVRWMNKKGVDYKPVKYSDAGTLPPVDPSNLVELGRCLESYRNAIGMTKIDLATRLGWANDESSAYGKLEGGIEGQHLSLFDSEKIIGLAQLLCPAESFEMAKLIDRVIHPYVFEAQVQSRLGVMP